MARILTLVYSLRASYVPAKVQERNGGSEVSDQCADVTFHVGTSYLRREYCTHRKPDKGGHRAHGTLNRHEQNVIY